jgi:hypothetical protein
MSGPEQTVDSNPENETPATRYGRIMKCHFPFRRETDTKHILASYTMLQRKLLCPLKRRIQVNQI